MASILPQPYKSLGRILAVAFVGIHIFFLWSVRGRVAKGDPDFTVFYTAAKIVREGRASQLYNAQTQQQVQQEFTTDSDIRRGPLPYIHPPFEALVFVPLTYLPYSQAFLLWNSLNLAMLFGIAFLLRRTMGDLRSLPLWECVLYLLAFFPVFINFLQGQDAILLLLLFVLGFCALDREADFLAGCWFGLAVFKYHLVLPLIVILLLWHGWKGRKLAFGFASTALAATLISLGIVGWHGALQYPAYAWHVVSVSGHGQTPFGMLPNLLGLATGWPGLEQPSWPVRGLVMAASIALLFAVARMKHLVNDPRFTRLGFAVAVITSLLVGYNTNAHDLTLLVLPLALLADYVTTHAWSPEIQKLLLPVMPLLISPLWIVLWIGWERINLMAIFLLWWMYVLRKEILRGKSGAKTERVTPLA